MTSTLRSSGRIDLEPTAEEEDERKLLEQEIDRANRRRMERFKLHTADAAGAGAARRPDSIELF